MKFQSLLIISNDFPNADNTYIREIFVKEQVKYLCNYFKDIYVICPIPYGLDYLRKNRYEDYTYENVHVYFPSYLNVPFFYSHFRNYWIHFATNIIFKIIEEKNMEFDLIHAHFTWPSGAVATRIKKRFNVPLVLTEHTSQTFSKAINRKDPLFMEVWNTSDAIIRIRKGDIHLFKEMGVDPRKVFYVPNGYDTIIFSHLSVKECRERLHIPLEKKVILYVANFYSEVKGHRYLIESISELVKKRQDILCVLVGDGKLRGELESVVNYFMFMGMRPHSEIPLWMNACDIFVLPSLNEGNPTVLFECLGSGKPFVGTKVGGIPEIIVSDDYGLLVEPGNSKKLAEAILVALDREWDSKIIIDYSAQFSWEKIADDIVNIYANTLSQVM